MQSHIRLISLTRIQLNETVDKNRSLFFCPNLYNQLIQKISTSQKYLHQRFDNCPFSYRNKLRAGIGDSAIFVEIRSCRHSTTPLIYRRLELARESFWGLAQVNYFGSRQLQSVKMTYNVVYYNKLQRLKNVADFIKTTLAVSLYR